MKKLNEILDCDYDVLVNDIKINSKEIEKGDLFVCTQGVNTNRHDFIEDAIKKGAIAAVISRDIECSIPTVKVNNPNELLGYISKKFYDDPCSKLKLIGVTGTDGKTTTSSIIRNMLGNDICGYIGTNGVSIKDKTFNTTNTTLEINDTYRYLNSFVSEGLKYSSMEISSEALFRNRTNTLELDVAIITNITEDHLNVHKSIDNYINSKKKIFNLLKKNGLAIINRDDSNYEKIIKDIKCKYITFGKSILSDLVIIDIKEYENGTIFSFNYKGTLYKVISPLIGDFNVYNLCGALLALEHFGYSISESIDRIININIVPGRCEFLNYGQDYKIVLDYAHTPNALENILNYLNKIKKDKRIITITGSAGGREKEKRKDMGKIVLSKSDLVIFTMDDPRYEKVDDIIDDMLSKTDKKNYIRIINREDAIKKGLSMCKSGDIILIAGKGRDNYMAIEDKKIDYSDLLVIESYFNLL